MLPEFSVSRWSQLALKRIGLGSTTLCALPHARESTERHEHCEEHEIDGQTFWRCSETRTRFRLAMDGQREVIETTTSETLRPAAAGVMLHMGDQPSTSPDQPVVLGAHFEQLLDEFVEYAIGLQSKLEAEDAGLQQHQWDSSMPRPHTSGGPFSGSGSSNSNSSTGAAAAAAATPAESRRSAWWWWR